MSLVRLILDQWCNETFFFYLLKKKGGGVSHEDLALSFMLTGHLTNNAVVKKFYVYLILENSYIIF